ncbi:MAG: ATP-binding cassette domain-containing protein [Oscillatoriales cyanobacterium RM2_1_1]|nr:ATP-binding cassette domain-containing protein [Oscillatoriales cyanobacterium SM2_3_0]NJO47016.1 ATP-binding cassette domain-containing protein [Oscillatoriales cyanobacterium RM2_1_1]
MQVEPIPPDPPAGRELTPSECPILELDQVSFKAAISPYPILQGISTTIHRGDRLAIVGITGSGKTAILRLLNRLDSPTQGTIRLNHQDYQAIPPVQLRQQVMLVLSEPRLLGMTVQDAIVYPLKLRGLNPQAIDHRVNLWLERLQIPQNWLNRTELQLSTGEKQWVAIARALAVQPSVLLLDEPFAHLDSRQQNHLVQGLATWVEAADPAPKPTIVIATCDLKLPQQFSTRLWHLDQGRLVLDIPQTEVNWHALQDDLSRAHQQVAQTWGEI